MKIAPFIAVSLLALSNHLFAADPVMDLKINSEGMLADASSAHRVLEINQVCLSTVAADKATLLEGGNAITVPYSSSDALFAVSHFTWIIKARFKNPPASNAMPLFGRWDAAHSARVATFSILKGAGSGRFLANATGVADDTVAAGLKTLPANQWISLVICYEAGSIQTIAAYNERGELIAKDAVPEARVPGSLFASDTPFVVGGEPELGFEFSRARVWANVLSDSDIKQEIGAH